MIPVPGTSGKTQPTASRKSSFPLKDAENLWVLLHHVQKMFDPSEVFCADEVLDAFHHFFARVL